MADLRSSMCCQLAPEIVSGTASEKSSEYERNFSNHQPVSDSMWNIGVAPITQVTHVRYKNSNIQGRSFNVIKVIFHTMRNCS